MNSSLFEFRKKQLIYRGKIAYAKNNISTLGVEKLEKEFKEYRQELDFFYQEAYNNISKYLSPNLNVALQNKSVTRGKEIVDSLNITYEAIDKTTLTIQEYNLLKLSFDFMYDYYNDPKTLLESEDRSFYIGWKVAIGTLIIPFMTLILSVLSFFTTNEISKKLTDDKYSFLFDPILKTNINCLTLLVVLGIILLMNLVYKKIDNIIKPITKYPTKYMLLPLYLSISSTALYSFIFFKILPNLNYKISVPATSIYDMYILVLIGAISFYFIRSAFSEKYLIEKTYDNKWNVLDIIGLILLLVFIVIPSILSVIFNFFPSLLYKNKNILEFITKIYTDPVGFINLGKILLIVTIIITIAMLVIDIVKQNLIKKA